MDAGARTDVGRVRENNEDAYRIEASTWCPLPPVSVMIPVPGRHVKCAVVAPVVTTGPARCR